MSEKDCQSSQWISLSLMTDIVGSLLCIGKPESSFHGLLITGLLLIFKVGIWERAVHSVYRECLS